MPMKKLTNCEHCGGNLTYNTAKAVVVCEHCDSVYPMQKKSRTAKLLRKYTIDFMPEATNDFVEQYMCKSCNSKHFVQAGKVSTRCPSCADTEIYKINEQKINPDGIIPFQLKKEQAVSIFDKWLKKRKFAPSDLIQMAKKGKLSQVYVPVFNINGNTVCAYNAMVKKVHTDSDSGTIYSTMHTVQDVVSDELKNVVLCANSVADSSLIKEVVRVDQSNIVPYSSEYLFGYTSATTDLSIHDLMNDLQNSIEKSLEKEVRAKLKDKYDEIVHLTCNTKLHGVTFNYTYVPVFMNHYKYNNKKYHCYICGTTGKVSGSAPKSAGKILGVVGIIAAIIGLAILLIL